jgi:hypothetical protein
MLQIKQTNLSRTQIVKLVQNASFKQIILHEPYDKNDQKSLLDILKRNSSEEISIIIGIHR